MKPREILGAAYTRSKKNRGASDIDENTEGLRVVQHALDRLYTLTARVNPEYFMDDALVSIFSGKWPLPAKAESVILIQKEDGTEVVVVPFEDRKLFAGLKPAVYFAGRGFKSAGNATDPISEDLFVTYAQGAPVLAIDTEIEELQWPSQHNDLLVDECAVFISLKDVRITEDLPVLKAERNDKARLYIAHLEHVNRNLIRRTYPQVVSSVGDVLSLLAGNGGGE